MINNINSSINEAENTLSDSLWAEEDNILVYLSTQEIE